MVQAWTPGDKTINAHEFAKSIIKWPLEETLTLSHYDGCGRTIACDTFDGLKVISCTEEFDYASSALAAIDFVIGYSSFKSEVCEELPLEKPAQSTKKPSLKKP